MHNYGVAKWGNVPYNKARKQERWDHWRGNTDPLTRLSDRSSGWEKGQWIPWSLMKRKGKKRSGSQVKSCRKRGIKMKLDIKSEQKWPLIVESLRTAVKGHFFLSVFEIAALAMTKVSANTVCWIMICWGESKNCDKTHADFVGYPHQSNGSHGQLPICQLPPREAFI